MPSEERCQSQSSDKPRVALALGAVAPIRPLRCDRAVRAIIMPVEARKALNLARKDQYVFACTIRSFSPKPF